MQLTKEDVERFKRGDTQAFEKIYEETKSLVYNVIYKMVYDKEEAYDLAHDVFIRVYDKRQSYEPASAIESWIYTIAVRFTLNYIKRRKWLRDAKDKISFFYNNIKVEEHEFDNVEDGCIQNCLQNMSVGDRSVIMLVDLEEKSYEDASGILQIPIGTVRSRLNRARKKLKNTYERKCQNEKL
jgi:RNA polymerase sigma-70 factor, ECF subfamily